MKKYLNPDVSFGLFFLLGAVYLLFLTTDMPESAAQFPKLVLSLLALLSILLILRGFRAAKKVEEKTEITVHHFKKALIAILIIAIYAALIRYIGFYTATSLFVIAFMRFFKEKRILAIILTIIGINLFIYFLFVVQLNVRLPKGILF